MYKEVIFCLSANNFTKGWQNFAHRLTYLPVT